MGLSRLRDVWLTEGGGFAASCTNVVEINVDV